MSLRLIFKAAEVGDFDQAFGALYGPVATAATAAMREAGDIAKKEGRAEIARAGFSRRWQNALRVDVYPNVGFGKVSAGPAAFIYHRIEYAGVFEEGATISGDPKLWLPLRNTPKKIGRNRVTPERMRAAGVSLFPINRPGKPPLLAARVRQTAKRASTGKVSLALLKRGISAKRGTLRSIPLFVGIDKVTIGKKIDIAGVVARARDRLAELYVRHFKDE